MGFGFGDEGDGELGGSGGGGGARAERPIRAPPPPNRALPADGLAGASPRGFCLAVNAFVVGVTQFLRIEPLLFARGKGYFAFPFCTTLLDSVLV